MRRSWITIGALVRVSLAFSLVASGLAGLLLTAGPAGAFGTYSKYPIGVLIHGQNREHEFITRFALACAPSVGWTIGEPCFEPRSIDQLAGRFGFLGAVGQPDIAEISNHPEAHCDDADYLATPGSQFYPKDGSMTLSQARDRRNANLESCVRHLKGLFEGAVTQAGGVLKGTHLNPDEVDVRVADCRNRAVGDSAELASAKCMVLAGFGRALHGTEDFYSHSNWADASDPNNPRLSIANPPGLNQPDPWTEINLGALTFPLNIPTDLTTGCAAIFDRSHCRARVNHDDLNKDEGDIDATGTGTKPTTRRGKFQQPGEDTNFAKAVKVAEQDAKKQWKGLQDRIRATYPPGLGNLVICALSRDDPVHGCDFTLSTESLLPPAAVGVEYSVPLHAVGPPTVTGWTRTGGGPPSGILVDAATGVISGKPTAAGTTTFTVEATAATGETATKDFDLTVAPAPAQEVVFSSDRTGRFQVWRANATTGGTLSQVTTAGSDVQEARRPDWSGASQLGAAGEITYQFGAPGVRGVHMVPPSGAGDVRLTPSRADETEPSWSPDGRFVVYVSTTAGASDLWVHAVGDPATTADDQDYELFATSSQELRPAWSPDGNHIAFVSSGGASGPDAEIAEIDVQDVGGAIQTVAGSFRLLTQNTFVDFDPNWSPDSRHIAFSSTRAGNRDVYRLDPCGSASGCESGPAFIQLTTNPTDDTNPAWSPDGTTIAFVAARDGNKEIYLLPADTGEVDPTRVVRLTIDSGNDDDPAWGPAPPRLEFTQEPSSPATVGKPFTLQPVVVAKDGRGNTMTSDSTTVVTLTLGAASTAVLSCPGGLSQTLVNGVATFGGCSVGRTGLGNVIRATAPGARPADTAALDVGRGSLRFAQQPPATSVSGLPMPTQPTVAVLDAAGNVDTHDSSTAVSLGADEGPVGGLRCSGGLTAHAVDGIARYSGCALDLTGIYTLGADAPGVPSATSTGVGAFPLQLLSLPALASLSPTSAPAGSASVVLTLDGDNFTGGSMVHVNGAARPTTFVSPTRLTTTLTAADLTSTVPVRTLDVSVADQPTGAESATLPFVVVGLGLAVVSSTAVPAGTAGTASTAPTAPSSAGLAGVTATLTNLAATDQVTVDAATYTGNPTPGGIIDVGAGFVDVRAEGADAASDVQVDFYYPASVSAPEGTLELVYWTGTAWAPVRSSGGTAPERNSSDDLDGTVSGGRLSVTVDGSSAPAVGGLTGTVFTATAPAPQAPAITSPNATTFTVATAGTFTVAATGSPAPTLSMTGAVPGGVSFNPATGVLSGSPGTGTAGSYPLVFTAANGVGPNATQDFTLTVVPAPQAPAITSPDTTTFTVGTAGTFTVTATGSPAPTLSMTGAVPGGVTFNAATGLLRGTPGTGTAGTYPLVFTAANGSGPDVTQNFTLTVVSGQPPGSNPPVAANDTYGTNEDTVLTVAAPGVLANDTDPDASNTLSALLVNGPAHGSLTLEANGSFTYTPAPNFNGPEGFTYKARDAAGALSETANVAIAVQPVNDAPVGVQDVYTTPEDVPLVVPAPGVLANDTDPDAGDTSHAVMVSGPTMGQLTLNPDGSFTYVPEANVVCIDGFTYILEDGNGGSSGSIDVVIAVTSVNDPPDAGGDSYVTDEDTPLTVSAPGVLANDTDIDSEASSLYAVLALPSEHGTLTLNPDGSFTYFPAANYHGGDTFSYRASDGGAESTPATVSITVDSVNDAPVATDDVYTTDEEAGVRVDPLANDRDVDGDTLSVVIVSPPSHGTLTPNADRSLTYTPQPDFADTEAFTYGASDGIALSNVATVTVMVRPVNDTPVAVNDVYSVDEDTQLSVPSPGVLSNDTDPDAGDKLSAELASRPAHGTLTFGTDGSFTYAPDSNFNGTDTFSYRAKDSTGAVSTEATVTVSVGAVNDPPLAVDDAYQTAEDTTLTMPAPGVLGNDSDIDGDMLHVRPGGSLNEDGSFVYTPPANFAGTETLTYVVTDGIAEATATVRIVVSPVDDPPEARLDRYSTDEDSALAVAAPGVLANDVDPDGGEIVGAELEARPARGTVTLNADGSFIYTPAANFNGTDSFTYRAKGPGGLRSEPGTVTITVNARNDAPVAQNDTASTDEETPVVIPASALLANDLDPDGDTLTVAAVTSTANTHGTVTLAAGRVTYAPQAGYAGPAEFTYTADDGHGGAAIATVTVTVRPLVHVLAGGAFGAQSSMRLGGLSPISLGPLPNVELPSGGGGPVVASLGSFDVSPVKVSGSDVSTEGKARGRQAFVRSAANLSRAEIASALTTVVSIEGVHSECLASGSGASASTTIRKLVVAGQTLNDLRPNPNTEVPLAGIGTLVLNEQLVNYRPPTSAVPGQRSITVNAIHLRLLPNSPLGSLDIILAQSTCGIVGPTVGSP